MVVSVLDHADVVIFSKAPLSANSASTTVLAKPDLCVTTSHDDLHALENLSLFVDAVVDFLDAHAWLPLSSEHLSIVYPFMLCMGPVHTNQIVRET